MRVEGGGRVPLVTSGHDSEEVIRLAGCKVEVHSVPHVVQNPHTRAFRLSLDRTDPHEVKVETRGKIRRGISIRDTKLRNGCCVFHGPVADHSTQQPPNRVPPA